MAFLGDTETVRKKERYLAERSKRLAVLKAARAARVNRAQIYRWRDADPEFAEADTAGKEEAIDALEDSMYQRALKGDTTAGIFLLKCQRRPVYGDVSRQEHTGLGGAPLAVKHEFDYVGYSAAFAQFASGRATELTLVGTDGADESLDPARADAPASVLPDGPAA